MTHSLGVIAQPRRCSIAARSVGPLLVSGGRRRGAAQARCRASTHVTTRACPSLMAVATCLVTSRPLPEMTLQRMRLPSICRCPRMSMRACARVYHKNLTWRAGALLLVSSFPISSVHRRNARSLTSVPRPTCFCSLAKRVVPFGDTVNAIPAIVHMAVGVCIRLPLSRAVRCTWHGEASARPACSPLGVMSARTGLGVESGRVSTRNRCGPFSRIATALAEHFACAR